MKISFKLLLYMIMCLCLVSCNIDKCYNQHDFDNTVAGAQCADDADFIYVSAPTTHEIFRIPKAGGDAQSLGLTGINLILQGETLYFSTLHRDNNIINDRLYAYSLTQQKDPVCIAERPDMMLQLYPVGDDFFAVHYLTPAVMIASNDGGATELPQEIYLRVTEMSSVVMDWHGVELGDGTVCHPVYRQDGDEKTHLFDFYVEEPIHPAVNQYCFFDGDAMYHVGNRDGVYTPLDNTCITRIAPDKDGVYQSEILYEGTASLKLLGIGNGNLYARHKDGTMLDVIDMEGKCLSRHALSADALCFVGNTDGLLYAVDAEEMTFKTYGGTSKKDTDKTVQHMNINRSPVTTEELCWDSAFFALCTVEERYPAAMTQGVTTDFRLRILQTSDPEKGILMILSSYACEAGRPTPTF